MLNKILIAFIIICVAGGTVQCNNTNGTNREIGAFDVNHAIKIITGKSK